MKNEKQRKRVRRVDAKRTALGRFLCRLLGDEAGQTIMEYVVLGVMVVAAAVAIVMLFGQQIRASWDKMIKSLRGEPDAASQVENVTDEDTARGIGKTITGGEANN